MHWMLDWGTPFPLFVAAAKGATLTDADGHGYADFCLGDTGAMFGHSAEAGRGSRAPQSERGFTAMLPSRGRGRSSASCWPGASACPVGRRTVTATDANRFVLRLARWLTGRTKVLVFNGCYHGTVDETFVRLKNGRPIHRPGLVGQAVDLTAHTNVIEFNDIPALEAHWRRAMSPASSPSRPLTNIGMVLPQPGFHDSLRAITRRTGTLLVIDETHSISTGPAATPAHSAWRRTSSSWQGDRRRHPGAVFGFTAKIAERLTKLWAATGTGPQWSRHHAVGQSSGDGGDARKPGRGDDDGRL